MTANGGNGNTVAGVFRALLTSPVGGWALAVVIVAIMAYLTFKDRQVMYEDVKNLRESAMPLIRENNKMLQDVYIEVMKKQP